MLAKVLVIVLIIGVCVAIPIEEPTPIGGPGRYKQGVTPLQPDDDLKTDPTSWYHRSWYSYGYPTYYRSYYRYPSYSYWYY